MPPDPTPITLPANSPAPPRPAADFRAPGAILLISSYELGHAPLGIASPAGFLAQAGYRPALLDLAVDKLGAEAVGRAAVVGFSVPMHTALKLAMAAARKVRTLNPACHLVFFGLYASLNEKLLLRSYADSVIGGEFEPPLLKLVRSLERAESAPPEGVSSRDNFAAPRLARTVFPGPSRWGLPSLTRYAHLVVGEERRTTGYVEASRGCRHTCLHCPITPVYQGRFFVVSREVVLADIASQVAMGARHITFGDPDFLNGPGHGMAILREMHARFPDVTFDVTAKIEHLLRYRKFLPELAKSGCLFVVSAVESLSNRVLEALNKGHTRADVSEALALVRAAGIALRPSWVPFTPWTTMEDYLEIVEFVASEGLLHHVEAVQFAVRLLVPPGSALLGTPQFAPFAGPLDAETLTHPWSHPDARMDALHRRVSDIVEQAIRSKEVAEETFSRIAREAFTLAGQEERLPPLLSALKGHPPAPRLSEPWFC